MATKKETKTEKPVAKKVFENADKPKKTNAEKKVAKENVISEKLTKSRNTLMSAAAAALQTSDVEATAVPEEKIKPSFTPPIQATKPTAKKEVVSDNLVYVGGKLSFDSVLTKQAQPVPGGFDITSLLK